MDRVHEDQRHGRGIGRDGRGDHEHDHVNVAPCRTEAGIGHDVEHGQVEHDERKLERNAKADHEQKLGVDEILELGHGGADGAGLLEQPLKGGRRDEGIAEDDAGEEQHGGDQHRGDNPAALIGAQGWQEERKNLPDDHGRAHGERDLDGDVELDGEAAERGHDGELLARAAGNR